MAKWLQTSGVELDRVGFWLAKGGWMGGRCLGRYLVRNDVIWICWVVGWWGGGCARDGYI